MSVAVINKYKAKNNLFINIQRPGVYGNRNVGEEAVAAYREDLRDTLRDNPDGDLSRGLKRLRQMHLKGHHIDLGCTCAPKSCHGDVIKEYIETGEV